jgi:hypothetical protein
MPVSIKISKKVGLVAFTVDAYCTIHVMRCEEKLCHFKVEYIMKSGLCVIVYFFFQRFIMFLLCFIQYLRFYGIHRI